MTQPDAVNFVGPTPIPRDAIAEWVRLSANVQVAWLDGKQKMLGAQGGAGAMARIYLKVTRNRQFGTDDYRQQSGVTLDGTISLKTGSNQVAFSTPQTLSAGQLLVFSTQPGQPYALASDVTGTTSATLVAPYTGSTTTEATTLATIAANLAGQRRLVVTLRAESFEPERADPMELLERVRWYGRTFTSTILEDAGCPYADCGEIHNLPAIKEPSGPGAGRVKLVATMDLMLNFAVNNTPEGAQAPGDSGDFIETVNQGDQEPTSPSTILGTVTPG